MDDPRMGREIEGEEREDLRGEIRGGNGAPENVGTDREVRK